MFSFIKNFWQVSPKEEDLGIQDLRNVFIYKNKERTKNGNQNPENRDGFSVNMKTP